MNEKRKKLTKSQKIALQMKSEKVQKFIALAQAWQKQVRATLNMIMIEEHNIPKHELSLWKLSEDEQAIERIEIPEPEEKEKDIESENK